MKLRLLAFGIAKDVLGTSSTDFVLETGTSVGELKAALVRAYPELKRLTSIAFAVNETYVQENYVLREGDEVVLIPPVSGG